MMGLSTHAYPACDADVSFSLWLADDTQVTFPVPAVMGIINCSPNSFFNPMSKLSDALFSVERMVKAGVDIIDFGGEATNPTIDIKKDAPSLQQEIDRIASVIEAVRSRFEVYISVDTSQPSVMKEAVKKGADIINDQRALTVPGALEQVAELQVPVCLMHSFEPLRQPGSSSPQQLLHDVKENLRTRVDTCLMAGIDSQRIIIDPGFGGGNYGKNKVENFYLLAHLSEFVEFCLPVLVGWSRKSMIGETLGNVSADQRLYGSLAAATIAAMNGASIIRVHDVTETMDVIRMVRQLNEVK